MAQRVGVPYVLIGGAWKAKGRGVVTPPPPPPYTARFPGDTPAGTILLGIDESDHNPEIVSGMEVFAPEAHTTVRCAAMRYYDGVGGPSGWTLVDVGGAHRTNVTNSLAKGRLPWCSVTATNWVTDADGRHNAAADSWIAWVETVPTGPVWFTLDHEADAGSKVTDRGGYAAFRTYNRWFRSRMDVYANAHGGVANYKWKNLAFATIFTANGYSGGEIDSFIPTPSADQHTWDFMGSDPYVQSPTANGYTIPFAAAVAWSNKYGWAHAVGEWGVPSIYSDAATKMQQMYDACTNGDHDVVAVLVWNNPQTADSPPTLNNVAANGYLGNKYVSLMERATSKHFWDLLRPDGTAYLKPPGADPDAI